MSLTAAADQWYIAKIASYSIEELLDDILENPEFLTDRYGP